MKIILPFVLIGLAFSLIIFFICEEKSLKNKKLAKEMCINYDASKVFVCFEEYNTFKYAGYFFLSVFIYTVLIAKFSFIEHNLGLTEVISYIALTALIGSAYIILFKWKKDLLVKVFSSFMFGSVFIASSTAAFTLSYLLWA